LHDQLIELTTQEFELLTLLARRLDNSSIAPRYSA